MVRAHTPEGDLIWINALQVQSYTVTETGNLRVIMASGDLITVNEEPERFGERLTEMLVGR
jgi:hypothetical protein